MTAFVLSLVALVGAVVVLVKTFTRLTLELSKLLRAVRALVQDYADLFRK